MKTSALEWGGCGVAAVLTVVQTQAIFQIVSLILTCVTTAVTLGFTIYKWYKDSKKDGKIDSNELQQGINIVKDGVDKINNIVSSVNEEDKEN